VAQVVAGRITSEHDVAAAQPGASGDPERVADDVREYLEQVHGQAADRTRDLGSAVVEETPGLGHEGARARCPRTPWPGWSGSRRPGALASYREAKGLEGSDRALPAAPGLSQTEARAAWWDAWEALGRPQETRVEAALSDGALQSRVAAWEREQAWAPAHADESLRQAELDAEEARQEAILARSIGDEEAAARWEQEAQDRATVADAMGTVAEARGEWAGQTAVTQDLAERARDELLSRGLAPGQEPDRTSAEEWLEHQREVDARDEAVRDVTELDVPLVEGEDRAASGAAESDTAVADGTPEVKADASDDLGDDLPEEPAQEEAGGSSEDGTTTGATDVSGRVDRSEAPGSVVAPVPSSDDSRDITPDEEQRATDSDGYVPEEQEPEVRPAHVVAPVHPEDAELDALVATAHDASATVADRESEESAHDAWEAEESTAPEAEGSPGTADVAEATYAPDTVDA
jgi:hypothetical protein